MALAITLCVPTVACSLAIQWDGLASGTSNGFADANVSVADGSDGASPVSPHDASEAGVGDGDPQDATSQDSAGTPDSGDAAPEGSTPPPAKGCTVRLMVRSAVAPEGGTVRVAGSIAELGLWIVAGSIPMSRVDAGVHSVDVRIADRTRFEFKFLTSNSGSTAPGWEQLGLFDSNRSMIVACDRDAGRIDASSPDNGIAYVGVDYFGVFGVRSPDVTK
jgi:Starch binding domain